MYKLLEMCRDHITEIDQAGFVLFADEDGEARIKLHERTRQHPFYYYN